MRGTALLAALGLLCSADATPPKRVETGDGDMDSAMRALSVPLTPAYYAWQYRWHRGGAWLFHEELHPCHASNASCSIARSKDARADVLAVNTTIVPHMGFVELQYDLGDDDAADGDFIGVYCVDEEESRARIVDPRHFFDYVLINATAEDSFRGRVVFGPLVNMRCSYQFRYMRHADKLQYVCLSESAHVEMERGHSEPVQVHLALTGEPGEMRVVWTSGRGGHQHVHYGVDARNLTRHTEATTDSYGAADLCGAPATIEEARWFRHPGYFHSGVMTGLEPGETYFYNVGSKMGIVSKPFSFTYPPLAGTSPQDETGDGSSSDSSSSDSSDGSGDVGDGDNTDDATLSTQSFFVFGDLGDSVMEKLRAGDAPERHFSALEYETRPSYASDKTVIRRIEQDLDEDDDGNFVGLVHVGDLSYATGRTYVWDQFGALIQPVASRLPYMVAIGNHEYDYTSGGHGHDPSGNVTGDVNGWHPRMGNYGNDSHGECGVPAAKRFHMPANGNQLFWYSFAVGLTHHIVLSSEHNCSAHAPMHSWLVHELKHNVNRTATPWLLVHVHRPLYCSENYASDESVSHILRGCLEHVLMKHHVDVVFSGHYHAYERTCPVYKDKCRVDDTGKGAAAAQSKALAPTHIMVGAAGAELDDVDNLNKTATPWTRNRQQEYGYGRFHVHNASHAHFEFVRARDRKVSDETWIVSDHTWSV